MKPTFAAGSISHRIDFFVYCCNKTISLSVSLYRDVKHYGQHMRFKSDHLLILICSKSEIFGSLLRGLETRVLPWQHLSGCHFVSYLMYITVAKFEYHYSHIFRDILNFVIYYVCDINFITKTLISLEQTKVFQHRKHHSSSI